MFYTSLVVGGVAVVDVGGGGGQNSILQLTQPS